MSAPSVSSAAAEYWHGLLRPEVECTEPFWQELASRMRAERLTFGDRVHCPFLRPMFLAPGDVSRVARLAEAVAAIAERFVEAALGDEALLDAVGLTDDERALVRLDPGYGRASTASRLDGFLLEREVWFAEYNAESPAGLGYTEVLARIFDGLDVMARFRERFEAEYFHLAPALLDALLSSYREWGGTERAPVVLITDWRDVPTWSEFEILQARFEDLGVPTIVADPRDLAFERGRLIAQGRRIDLVYRRVLINDILARPDECRALVEAYAARAACVANTFRCKIPHKKAFFAVLTGEAADRLLTDEERRVVACCIPWTRLLRAEATTVDGRRLDLPAYARRERDSLVIKPNDEYGGTGVVLGWEATASEWDRAIDRAVGEPGRWVVQRRIPVRREVFPAVAFPEPVAMRDMLVDLAPYLFRGRVAGFLTRLSSTGLANVTSGGGQVPSFVVASRAR